MPAPQIGERRSGATETVQWDGSRWQPISPDISAEKGYHPGLADSEHPWLAQLKGFFSGAAEAATPAKIGTLAALTIPGVLPAALVGAGGTAALEMLRSHFDTANAPQSGGEFLGDVAGGAAPALLGGAVSKGASAIDKGLELASQVPGKIGAVSKLARGVSNVLPNVLNTRLGTLPWETPAADAVGAAASSATRSRPTTINWSGPDVEGMFERATNPGPARWPGEVEASPVDRYMPNTPGTPSGFADAADAPPQPSILRGADQYAHGGDPRTVETYAQQFGPNPEFQTIEPGDVPPRLVKGGSGEPATVESALDTVLKGLSNEGTSTSRLADTPSVRSMDRGNMANGFPRMSPEEMGRAQAGAFRTGANIPSGATPTEQLFEDDIAGPHFDPHEEAGYVEPGDVHVVDPTPMHAGQDVPSSGDVEDLVKHLFPAEAVPTEPAQQPTSAYDAAQARIKHYSDRLDATSSAMANPGAGMPDSLKAIDDMFGPGVADTGGAPFQSTEGFKGANNLLYDPQTPSDYLREQMQTTDNPDESAFLGKALRQRLRLGQSAAFQSPR